MTLPWRGELGDPVLTVDLSGDVVHEHDYASAPIQVSGFAGIVDVWLDADAYLNPVGASGHDILSSHIVWL